MSEELKDKIIEKINDTKNVDLLNAVFVLLNSSEENIKDFINQEKKIFNSDKSIQNVKDINDRKDYTSYIKEWIKNFN